MSTQTHSTTAIIVAIIGGIFVVFAACVTGVFLLTNTLLEQGFIVIGPGIRVGNPGVQSPTAAPQPTAQPTFPTQVPPPQPTVQPTFPTKVPPQSTPLRTSSPSQSQDTCYFIDELLTKGSVIRSLDVPEGSRYWAGVVIHLNTSVNLPAGWIVQRENQPDVTGPATIPAGITASFWSPESCRPLKGPFVKAESCTFLDVLATSGKISRWLYYPEGVLAGAVVQLAKSVDVPNGWIVDVGQERKFGPTTIQAGTTASFWSPEDCRPLRTP